MKVLYHHRIASKDGQFVHVEAITHSLVTLGCELKVVSPSVADNQSFGGDGGFVSKLKSLLPSALYETLEFVYSFWAFIKMSLAIVQFRPDVIYERYNLYLPAGVWASKLFNIPILLEVNAPLFEERSRFNSIALKRLARWTQSYTWKNASVVLPVTEVLAKVVEEYGVSADRIEVIHNGIDQTLFAPKDEVEQIEGKATITIGFVGFVREWHKLEYLVELIANSIDDNLKLLIVGDGPAIETIEKLAQQLKVAHQIEITGLVERDKMPHYLSQIDIAIQPAVVPYASPLKLIEYLAMGLAIVAPAQPNIEELLSHEHNALLFNPDSAEECALCVKRFIESPELISRLSMAATKTIVSKQLIWDSNAQRIIALSKQARVQKAAQ
jgi:glycosyltransferase involved in cell wall biosynthesis